jgi:hypothetical protein
MRHKAIKELFDLIKIEDWTSFAPEAKRKTALEAWLDKWVLEASDRQLVINYKRLPLEHQELVKSKLAQNLAEQAMEQSVAFKAEDHAINGSMLVIKREIKP